MCCHPSMSLSLSLYLKDNTQIATILRKTISKSITTQIEKLIIPVCVQPLMLNNKPNGEIYIKYTHKEDLTSPHGAYEQRHTICHTYHSRKQ